jgi:phosphoribosyl-AMP cyclohydrolase
MMEQTNTDWIDEVSFDDLGLIPVIAQDFQSKRVLMVAWMDKNALLETVKTGLATYWSRSRSQLWRKGESSGHEQVVKSVQLDCDGDVLTLLVEQKGNIACHTGRNSCFFKVLTKDGWEISEPVLKDPKEIYSDG